MNAPIAHDTLPLTGASQDAGATPTCENCREPFTPRKGSGGKPQRYCSQTCKSEFHASTQRKPTLVANVGDQPASLSAADHSEANPIAHALSELLAKGATDAQIVAAMRVLAPASPPVSPQQSQDEGDEGIEFRWRDCSTVLEEQRAIAIYTNPNDALIIRQERAWDQEEDSLVFICKSNIPDFLDKLIDFCGWPTLPAPAPAKGSR